MTLTPRSYSAQRRCCRDSQTRAELPGRVRLLFQPSEEDRDENGISGGQLMVTEGALRGVDAVFGLHVDADTEVGRVGTRAGGLMAAGDVVEIIVRGAGGHGARPHLANDPLVLSAHLLLVIQDIVSRRLDPLQSGVISLTTIHGGTADNVIPDSVRLTGTVRSLTAETRQLLHGELRRACGVVEALGGSVELNIRAGYPPLVNDGGATAVAFTTLQDMLGAEQIFEKPPIMASEDFSFMLQEAPGCFLRLGVRNPEWERVYPVHTSTFR
jgi:amidohydrolase